MIRRVLASLALLVPGMAAAQTVEPSLGRLEILGTAPSACVIRAPSAATGNNATFEPAGGTSGQIRITELADPATAQSRGASIDLVVPVICNSPHRLIVRSGSGGLRRVGAPVPAGAFAERLGYRVNTVWGADQLSFNAEQTGPFIINSAEARAGQLSLSINIAQGGRPLVAGFYGDQIVLELEAAN